MIVSMIVPILIRSRRARAPKLAVTSGA